MSVKVEIRGLKIQHDGPAPYVARCASEAGRFWFVAGSDGINRIRYLTRPGVVLFTREFAQEIAAALNDAVGMTG
jgi:hypothetical protein